jgi:hypothetical protein
MPYKCVCDDYMPLFAYKMYIFFNSTVDYMY